MATTSLGSRKFERGRAQIGFPRPVAGNPFYDEAIPPQFAEIDCHPSEIVRTKYARSRPLSLAEIGWVVASKKAHKLSATDRVILLDSDGKPGLKSRCTVWDASRTKHRN
ncbi:hypothetical protein RFM41_33840 [Mesorhizobium sp. VK25A]|uniref:Uncharacterized protein n=1 Tax=Mesorhizobium vachelliae TaxID=3072309 RepID=A0ABU5AF91_9HYPH|nr:MULTISPECIES: hypothetical protein [unclassified Mesorhizobium]MDX8535950.1 hypothetical protein [Mesorhizobium sp. VK25D]MDX8548703.1 hypothetical protein [Mesorhizobium sp. VK25A]